jgi:hypothetical protein
MPRGLRKVRVSFDGTGFTRFGGLLLFQQFCKYLGLRYFIQHKVNWKSIHGNTIYHPVDLFLTYLFAIVAGIGRVENTKSLVSNGLLPSLLGLPNFPHRDTLRSFLWKITPDTLEDIQLAHDKLRQYIFQRSGPIYSSIIDLDTTALTVYGHQEGSEVGYNPYHRGKSSYCPIICTEGSLGLTLNFRLRSGNVHPGTDAVSFLTESLDKLPETVANTRTRIRADASFYNKNFVNFLDDNRIGYVIVARLTGPVKNILSGISYHLFQRNWDCDEFYYQPCLWKTEHRFIGIRRLIEEDDFPTTLFNVKGYTYRALVTNLDLNPLAVWRFYCKRAVQELLIRELKNDYTLAKIPTRSFLANQVYLEIVLWAYDLAMAFKHFCLPREYQNWTMSTLRRNLWVLPAELVRPMNYNRVRLPVQFPYQDVFQYAQRTVAKVKSLM